MDFQPTTLIYFCRTGIDDNNKIYCQTQEELFSTITREGNVQGRTVDNSFQRSGVVDFIRVDLNEIPYYLLLQCDTVLYQNQGMTGLFWVVGNILSVEWKNPDCAYVHFKIDQFMTYQNFINWSKTYAFIEREHVKEDWASEGGNPLFTNMGPAEDMGVVPDTPFFTWSKGYQCNKVVILSPYDSTGKPQFNGNIRSNLYSSLNIQVLDPNGANAFFKSIAESKEASINNIVAVYGIPEEWEAAVVSTFGGSPDVTEELPAVNVAIKDSTYPEFNNAKTLSGPYVTVKLYSSEGDVLEFNPQWFGHDLDNYILHMTAEGAGGLFGGLAAYFENQNGKLNWKVSQDFTVMNKELPSCPWTGDGFTDWQSVNAIPTLMKVLASTSRTFVNMAGNHVRETVRGAEEGRSTIENQVEHGLNQIANYTQTMAAIAQQIKQAKASGATLNGGKTFSSLFDLGQDSWGFKVIYYAAQPYLMRSIDAYFDRFGYRVARLKQLELVTRPIWNFIKTSECHVVGNPGIPYTSQVLIDAMFNNGVTFWNRSKYMSGRQIGDFSNANENKGIMGASL